jgi:hypothetical protein
MTVKVKDTCYYALLAFPRTLKERSDIVKMGWRETNINSLKSMLKGSREHPPHLTP